MNLKQLITSREKVESGMWDTSKPFQKKKMGSIIKLELNGEYNKRNKTLSITLVIKAATQEYETLDSNVESLGRYYDKVEKKRGKKFKKRNLHVSEGDKVFAHTCTISFKNIEEFRINIADRYNQYLEGSELTDQDIQNLVEDDINVLKQEYGVVEVGRENGDTIFRTPISLLSEVNVRCTCANFFYAFMEYNGENNCLIGTKAGSYVRRESDTEKTKEGKPKKRWHFKSLPRKSYIGFDPVTQERVDVQSMNMNRVPGICKHLQLLIAILIEKDLLNTVNYNDVFLSNINPEEFVNKKLRGFARKKALLLEEEAKLAKINLKDYLRNLKVSISELKDADK